MKYLVYVCWTTMLFQELTKYLKTILANSQVSKFTVFLEIENWVF